MPRNGRRRICGEFSDRNPTWDFLLYTDDPAANSEGSWNGRLLYKQFIGRDDILNEYRDFQSGVGHDWVAPSLG